MNLTIMINRLKKGAKNLKFLIVSTLLLLIAFISEKKLERESDLSFKADKISSYLIDKRAEIRDSILNFSLLEEDTIININRAIEDQFAPIIEEDGYLLIYENGTLNYWSDNSVTFYKEFRFIPRRRGVIKLPNGWYLIETFKKESRQIAILYLIKSEYKYKNRYLPRSFSQSLGVDNNSELSLFDKGGVEVVDSSGAVMFYINNKIERGEPSVEVQLIAVLYLISLLFFLIYMASVIGRYRWRSPFYPIVVSTVIFYLIFYGIREGYIYGIMDQLMVFSPYYLSAEYIATSVGDLFLFSISILFLSIIISNTLYKSSSLDRGKRSVMWLSRVVIPILTVSQYLLFITLFEEVMLNSNLDLRVAGDLNFSLFDSIALISLIIIFFSFAYLLLAHRLVVVSCYKRGAPKQCSGRSWLSREGCNFECWIVWLINLVGGVVCLTILTLKEDILYSGVFIGFLTIMGIIQSLNRVNYQKYKFYILAIFALIGTLLSNSMIDKYGEIRNLEQQELMAEILVSERDPIAEILISDAEDKIVGSSVVFNFENDLDRDKSRDEHYEAIRVRVDKIFSTGYWKNFDLYVTVCDEAGQLLVEDESQDDDGTLVNCHNFFRELIISDGVMVPETGFYYMDRMDGRISYMGEIEIEKVSGEGSVSIFIELNSRVMSEGQGYPELLLDENIKSTKLSKDFSFAKYSGGNLIYHRGDFEYSNFIGNYPILDQEYSRFDLNGYRHLAYFVDNGNFIVVSYKVSGSILDMDGIPYMFLLFMLLGLIIHSRIMFIYNDRSNRKDLSVRINRSIAFLVLSIMVVIGVGVVLYNMNTLHRQSYNVLEERIRAVTTAIEFNIGSEIELDGDNLDLLTLELIDLSEVFHLDINIYDLDGLLITTSRSEIVDKGLIGVGIDPTALEKIDRSIKETFILQESIGKLSYSSVYLPLYNSNFRLIGYVNIPYFTGDDDVQEEVTNFVVTFINFFIFIMLLTIVVALSISSKITEPLSLLEKKLSRIKLVGGNEKINFESNNEIGRLVKVYNHQVDELERGAKLLAKSERESAWGEMARQVAHEIKNPLTPMKLSIQYLISMKGDRDRFDTYFDKVAISLIEQIDNLARIANSFSDFAKAGSGKQEPLNPVDSINELLTLMRHEGDVDIESNFRGEDNPIAFNKEHFSRVLINIIKNGQQSVDGGERSVIHIKVKKSDDYCNITVTDNGKGIEESVGKRLFEPYFTTKSSGTGLGLAITARLVESSGGKISFTTEVGKGTTFLIQVPWWVD